MVSFLVALCELLLLCRKACTLVNRIVKLGVCVAHLPTVHKHLETLNVFGIVGLLLGKGRDLDGMVHNEGRLNEMLLNEVLEEEVENVALGVAILVVNALFVSNLACLLKSADLLEVNAGILLYGVNHGDALEGLAEIHCNTVVNDGGGAENLFCHVAEHILGEIHHSVVVGVRLVKLHQRKFGIVSCVKSLVSEYTSDLINSLKSADDKAL